ncbi:ATP-binding protein [Paenibacillus sp. GSMTC-2017]|uniref:ATP-binding protein n=1 Tax=Paenibacillus sp. GSMTC-2017 TaxID=2794350 RepID=UPI003FA6EA3F
MIGNAKKYAGPSSEITIVANMGAEGDAIRITIRDSGSGMPPEDLPYLFDHFY